MLGGEPSYTLGVRVVAELGDVLADACECPNCVLCTRLVIKVRCCTATVSSHAVPSHALWPGESGGQLLRVRMCIPRGLQSQTVPVQVVQSPAFRQEARSRRRW